MIDIDKLKEAKDYYQSNGYKYLVDVPWHCPPDIQAYTKPNDIAPSKLDDKTYLVGSAEQAFLEKIFTGKMPSGFHQTITPCFRNDKEDDLHQLYFIKLELIAFWPNVFVDFTTQLASDALIFFNKFVPCTIVKTDKGLDIVDKKHKIELGSYGSRTFKGQFYTYGTGLALPRLNYVISLLEK